MKKSFIHKVPKRVLICTSTAAGVLPAILTAAPLNLSTKPLVVAEAADPNVMVLFDTSGSMNHMTPSQDYDSDATYGTCKNNLRLSTGTEIELVFSGAGNAYPVIKQGNNYYFHDFNSGTSRDNGGPYSLNGKCFDDDANYRATLTTTSIATGAGALYSGHYLNYYFSTELGSWDPTDEHHPKQYTRSEVGKIVLKSFITERDDDTINLGLSTLDGGSGAEINEAIAPLTASAKSTLTAAGGVIDGFHADGSTPLAEAFSEIARYFIGSPSTVLQLQPHPNDDPLPSTEDYRDFFDLPPQYASGVSTASPIDAIKFCEKNYLIALTDGQPTNDDDNISATLSDYDRDCSGANASNCESPFNRDRKNTGGYSYQFNDSSDYMDDVAMAMYEMDLRPDVNRKSGDAFVNNLSTYIIGFADQGIKTDPLFDDVAKNGSGGVEDPFFPDDLDELQGAFDAIISKILTQEGSVASVSFNSGQLDAGSALFQAKFNTVPWHGNLLAYSLNDATGTIQVPEVWDAAKKLDNMSSPHTTRDVFTYDPDASVRDGVSVSVANWTNVPATLKADLYLGVDRDGDGVSTVDSGVDDDDDAQSLLEYLLGDDTFEGSGANSYRVRNDGTDKNRLGDIVNSTPVFVGEPELAWPDYATDNRFGTSSKNYSAFVTANASRTPVVYVGANDGMLHGFNAELSGTSAGKEVMAYIPSTVVSTAANKGLHYLASQSYEHEFYVDLTPAVSDVYLTSKSDWATILVGGVREGGRGLFALDVTDPGDYTTASNAANIVLWEFTSSDDADLGYTYSQPTIAMMPNGEWAAIVGNGYNSTGDGHAKLFIIYINKGTDGTWVAGDYVKIDTGVGSTTTPNGLSTPRAADIDGDLVVDRIYAGDLEGNMWVFDVSSTSDGSWGVVNNAPLFTSASQPITSAPILSINSESAGSAPNVLVSFGTGKYLESTDVSNTTTMSFYTVWDVGTSSLSRSDLEPRSLSQTTVNYQILRTVSGNPVDWATQYGWRMDLPATGERVVSDPQIRRQVLFFNTVIPSSVACSSGGSGWLMSVDFLTGLAPPFPVFDANNDGTIDNSDLGYVGWYFADSLPAKSGFLGDKQYTPGSDGSIKEREIEVGQGTNEGRLTWEEVYRN
ncbi:PilC/PilY family type IV pilus protein [Aurantivibrio plasticivorans]